MKLIHEIFIRKLNRNLRVNTMKGKPQKIKKTVNPEIVNKDEDWKKYYRHEQTPSQKKKLAKIKQKKEKEQTVHMPKDPEEQNKLMNKRNRAGIIRERSRKPRSP